VLPFAKQQISTINADGLPDDDVMALHAFIAFTGSYKPSI
jgi:hypothetical protein